MDYFVSSKMMRTFALAFEKSMTFTSWDFLSHSTEVGEAEAKEERVL